MPYFEVFLFQRGSNTPFLSSPRFTTLPGCYNAGDTLTVGSAGPVLAIGAIAHRWLPGPNNEPLMQTALVVSAQAAGLLENESAPWLKPSGDFVPWPLSQEAVEDVGKVFEGVATTLEEAVKIAHAQVPMRPHRDFTVSEVVGWGMQRGGIADQTRFYVQVEEDPEAQFRSDRVVEETDTPGQV